jgi:hypothetical protein
MACQFRRTRQVSSASPHCRLASVLRDTQLPFCGRTSKASDTKSRGDIVGFAAAYATRSYMLNPRHLKREGIVCTRLGGATQLASFPAIQLGVRLQAPGSRCAQTNFRVYRGTALGSKKMVRGRIGGMRGPVAGGWSRGCRAAALTTRDARGGEWICLGKGRLRRMGTSG